LKSQWNVHAAKSVWIEGKGCLSVSETCELIIVTDDDSSKEKKRKELLNNLINNSINNYSYIIRSFSLPRTEETLHLLEDLKTRAKIDGLTASKLIHFALEEYMERHPVPNPQLLMAYYVKPEERQPLRVLCSYCQGALSDGRVFCQNKGMWIPGVSCYSCKGNRLRKQK